MEGGQLRPLLQEWLLRLAVWMSFGRAVELRASISGVKVGEETARRQTEKAGAASEQVQEQEAQRLLNPDEAVSPEQFLPAERQLVSSDGAMVPILKREGGWAEVKTLVIAQQKRDQQQRMRTEKRSYFSRLADAENFADLALVQTRRRGLEQTLSPWRR